MNSVLDAYEALLTAEKTRLALEAGRDLLAKRADLPHELTWIASAIDRLGSAFAGHGDLLDGALGLPELESQRATRARYHMLAWVDGLEKLVAGITFHASGRAPLLETLFPKRAKLVPLRKASMEAAAEFQADFEKRLASSYAKRMLSDPAYAFAQATVDTIHSAWSTAQRALTPGALAEEEAAAARAAVLAAAHAIVPALRQARLLAEAALVPVEGAFEECGFSLRRRKAPHAQARTDAAPEAEAQAPEEPVSTEPAVEAAPRERSGRRSTRPAPSA